MLMMIPKEKAAGDGSIIMPANRETDSVKK